MHPAALPTPVQSAPNGAANDTTISVQRLDHIEPLDAVCELLLQAWKQGCHELHIDQDLSNWRIRRRTPTGLDEQRVDSRSALGEAIAALRHAMPTPQECGMSDASSWRIGDGSDALTLLAWRLPGVEDFHLRFELGQHAVAPVLDTLGLSAHELRTLRGWLSEPTGWVIAAGVTAIGTRRLHDALAQELNVPDRKLLNIAAVHTAPQPREIRLPIAAVESAARLSAAVRAQCPDVLLIEQSPGAGLSAPLRDQILHNGLLIQTTLAANRSDLLRQLEAGGQSDAFLSTYLTGLLVHQPVRRLCEHCKGASAPGPQEREWLSRHRTPAKDNVMAWLNEGELHHYLRGEGCEQCAHSGYAGHHDLFDVIDSDELISHTHAPPGATRQRLQDRALDLARRGEIPLMEVIRLCP